MAGNPLEKHFRRSLIWLRLPSGGRWYGDGQVKMNENCEVQIKGISAIDEVLLNTPDAMLNGYALETVIRSCVPDVVDIKALVQPDIEAIFLGIKAATNRGKFEITRRCDKCEHENTFDVVCQHVMHNMTYIEDSDCMVEIDGELIVHLRPYNYDNRTIMVRKQIEEQRALDELEKQAAGDDDLLRQMSRLSASVERMAQLTYSMIADSIVSVEILRPEHVHVTDKNHIAEWITHIDRDTAKAIVKATEDLNRIGPPKTIPAQCQACGHNWEEPLVYDPSLFSI